jgi:hypothetical protein
MSGISNGPLLCSFFPSTDACALQIGQHTCDILAPHTTQIFQQASAFFFPLQFEAASVLEAQMLCNTSRGLLMPLTLEHVPLEEYVSSAHQSHALELQLPVWREASGSSPRASHNL